MREVTIKVGQPIPLQGIASLPANQQSKLGVILLNSGIMHRVGACRLTVKVARRITEELGIHCLRFDFSGIGDSGPRRAGNPDYDAIPVQEVQEVMDYCQQQYGIERFILYGLCSGADIACKAAELDDRVTSVIQVDGYSYPTWKSYFLHYLQRTISIKAWLNRFKKIFGLSSNTSSAKQVLTAGNDDQNFEIPLFPQIPPKNTVHQRLSTIVNKNISLYCAFAGKSLNYYYQNQYLDCMSTIEFGDQLRLDHFPGASHIFTEPKYQEKLVKSIVRYLKEKVVD